LSVLDMCTGSGCILISLLKLHDNIVSGYGVDISQKALSVAKKNAVKHNISPIFIESDMFNNLKNLPKMDIIVSNPPYIAANIIDTLDKSVKDYEPTNALDGGETGLYFYEKIANEARNFLKENGVIFLEIGYDQGEKIKNIFKNYKSVIIIKDYANLDRIVKIEV